MGGYQLWLALPPELELADPESIYVEPERVAGNDSMRVALGEYEGMKGVTQLPFPITYLHVRLADGERWTYMPGNDHGVAFLALNAGKVHTADTVVERELVVFEKGNAQINLVAVGARSPIPAGKRLLLGAYQSRGTCGRRAEYRGTRPVRGCCKAPATLTCRIMN